MCREVMKRPTKTAVGIVAAVSLAGHIGCLTARGQGEREKKYESCVHQAFEPVFDGWVCSADGQITGIFFSGHVVTEIRAGQLAPLKSVQFTRAYVSPSGAVAEAERVDVSVSSDGWFTIPQQVGYVEALQMKNGHIIASESLDNYLYIIHADGCQDYTVHFRTDDPDRVIIMKCDGSQPFPTGDGQ
jgi:hypothetical protein